MSLSFSCVDSKNTSIELQTLVKTKKEVIPSAFFNRFFKEHGRVSRVELQELVEESLHVVFHLSEPFVPRSFLKRVLKVASAQAILSFYGNPVAYGATFGPYKVVWVFEKIKAWTPLENPVFAPKENSPVHRFIRWAYPIDAHQAFFYFKLLEDRLQVTSHVEKALQGPLKFIKSELLPVYLDHFLNNETAFSVVLSQLKLIEKVSSLYYVPDELIFHLFSKLHEAKSSYLEYVLENRGALDFPEALFYLFLVKKTLKERGKSPEFLDDERDIQTLIDSCQNPSCGFNEGWIGIIPNLKIRKMIAAILPKQIFAYQPSFLIPKNEEEVKHYLEASGPLYFLGLLGAIKEQTSYPILQSHRLNFKKIDPLFLRTLISFAALHGASSVLETLFINMQSPSFVPLKKELQPSFFICLSSITDSALANFFDPFYVKSLSQEQIFSMLDRMFLSSRPKLACYIMHLKSFGMEEIWGFILRLIEIRNTYCLRSLFSCGYPFFNKKAQMLEIEKRLRLSNAVDEIYELIKVFPQAAKTPAEVLKIEKHHLESFFKICSKPLLKSFLMRCIECEAKQLFDKIFVTYNDKLSAFDQFELFQYAISLNQRLMIKDLIEYLELSEIQYRLLYVQYATKFNRIDPAFFLHPRFNGLSWGQKKEFLQFLFKKIPITHISYAMMFMKDAISEDDIFGEGEELGLFSSFIFERSFEGLYVLKHSPHLDQKRWDEFFEFMLLSRNYFQVVKFKLEDEHHFTADQVQNLFQMLENKTITPAQKAFVLEIFEQEKKADIKLIEKFFSLSLPKISDQKAREIYQALLIAADESCEFKALGKLPVQQRRSFLYRLISMHLFDGLNPPEELALAGIKPYRSKFLALHPLDPKALGKKGSPLGF